MQYCVKKSSYLTVFNNLHGVSFKVTPPRLHTTLHKSPCPYAA